MARWRFFHSKGFYSSDISEITWDGDTQDTDFSYILDQTTPVKACSFDLCGKMGKEFNEGQGPSSRVKRHRALQFDDDVNFNLTSQIDDLSFLKSKEKIDEAISDSSQQGIGSQEASSFSGLDCLEDQVEDWLGGCFNYSQTTNPTADISPCGTTNVLLDISANLYRKSKCRFLPKAILVYLLSWSSR